MVDKSEVAEFMQEGNKSVKNEQFDFSMDQQEVIETALRGTFENLEYDIKSGVEVGSRDEFREMLTEAVSVDETDIIGLRIREQVDFAYQAEEMTGEGPSIDSWRDLEREVEVAATGGLDMIVRDRLSVITNEVSVFVEEHDLNWENIAFDNEFGYAVADGMSQVRGGEVTEYRGADGDIDVDVYRIRVGDEFGASIDVYFNDFLN